MSDYEVWLTDDSGHRFDLIENFAFLSYTRSSIGLGTFNLGMPLKAFGHIPFFRPDWRAEVWRSPGKNFPLRLEDVYLLRKPNVYVRKDGMEMIQFYGRNGLDLLYRRSVIQRPGTSWAQKTDQIDDMMKAIVREQMLYGSALDEDGVVDNTRAWPQNEFFVQADISQGPLISRGFSGRKVIDILRDLKSTSEQYNLDDEDNPVIYFDVAPLAIDPSDNTNSSPLGWEFRTYIGLRGVDRTASGQIFSVENENMNSPEYNDDHLEEVSSVFVHGNGQGNTVLITSVDDTDRVNSSRWNRCEKIISASSEVDTTGMQAAARAELGNSKPKETLTAAVLDNPGSLTTPRSLYGLDWDLGDKLRAKFAGMFFEIELQTVYVSIDENGAESISGRNEVGNAG